MFVLENHRKPIYAVAFNQVDPALSSFFATIGSNCASVYRIQELQPEVRADGSADERLATEAENDATCRPKTTSQKRKKRRRLGSVGSESLDDVVLERVQQYQDDDTDESFYCCDWGVLELDSSSLLAVAGEKRQIKVINCRTGQLDSVMQAHGAAVHDVRFHPTQPSLLLSASADESVRLWHVLSRDCIAVFAGAQGHRDAGASTPAQSRLHTHTRRHQNDG